MCLAAGHVRTLNVDPRDADRFAIASGDKFDRPAGIYVSHDGDRRFSMLEGGLDLPTGIRLLVFVDRRRLFFVTRGSGIFTRILP